MEGRGRPGISAVKNGKPKKKRRKLEKLRSYLTGTARHKCHDEAQETRGRQGKGLIGRVPAGAMNGNYRGEGAFGVGAEWKKKNAGPAPRRPFSPRQKLVGGGGGSGAESKPGQKEKDCAGSKNMRARRSWRDGAPEKGRGKWTIDTLKLFGKSSR